MSTFTHSVASNNFGCAKWIVSANVYEGTHTTIASALTAASSGDTILIRPGTYTENLTLKAGVNLCAYDCDALTPNVTISGKATFTAAGTVSISGIRLQTNSDFLLAITGSAASIVKLDNCYLNCSNNTGISFTTSSASAKLIISNTQGDLATTGIAYFSGSTAGFLELIFCDLTNSGGSTTASTWASTGLLNLRSVKMWNPITYSSSNTNSGIEFSALDIRNSSTIGALNATALTTSGTGGVTAANCFFVSGSASAISIGSGTTVTITDSSVFSSNTNAITGAGTIIYSSIAFTGSSNTVNTTTQTALVLRTGHTRSTLQPAFAAYLGSNVANQSGAGGVYTLGTSGSTALTEIFDQNSDFNTNGTFTAPYTGRYELNFNIVFNGCTVATTIVSGFVTSNRNWYGYFQRPAGTSDITTQLSHLVDMDVADTAVVTASITGEAGNTDDVVGQSDIYTGFSGIMVC